MGETHDDRPLDSLLGYLNDARGVNFAGYKRSSLRRRINRRLKALSMGEDLDTYRAYLREHPDELTLLLDSIFINVTSFFRDPEAWAYLAQQVIPTVVQRKADGAIRVWSAGCASGEEPFTAAILLAEELGIEMFTRNVKIYATDWDEAALVQARRARYELSAMESVREDLKQKYFQVEDGTAVLNHTLRRAVIFGQHDIVEDAPISRIDLLLCRNTIMYFNVDTQARIVSRLHFALEEHGVLFLGRAEMLLSHTRSFTPVELKHRVFMKVPHNATRDGRPLPVAPARRRDEDLVRGHHLREAALEASPVAQVSITPFLRDGTLMATTITSGDVTHHHELQKNLQRFSDNLETAYEELQSANEELETTNEELQSANEELETTNEELQAANEEMETVNEELRSTNEELQAVNDRLRQHEDELNRSNVFLNAILASLRAGLMVLGEDLTVRVWNELAVDLWGVRAEEAQGRAFTDLDIGLPVAHLAAPVRDILTQRDGHTRSHEVTVEAINRMGQRFQCRVVVTRLAPVSGIPNGVCILMEDFASRVEPTDGEAKQQRR